MGMTGGCMCGGVRYELKSDPFDPGWCNCRTCQLNSGSPAMAFASVRKADWSAIKGAELLKTIQSSSFGKRTFCGACGTPLYVHVDHQPDRLDFSIVTLDDCDAIAPEWHIFWSSKVSWFNPGDDLPKHERFRPGTEGLPGIEPPDGSSMVGGAGNAGNAA
jgi:hypothetical protein